MEKLSDEKFKAGYEYGKANIKRGRNTAAARDCGDSTGFVKIAAEEYEALKKDKARLDFLESAHDALNSRYGTDYGWELIINHNVVRAMVENCAPRDGRDGIDLYDTKGGHAKVKTCRKAIDDFISRNTEDRRPEPETSNQPKH